MESFNFFSHSTDHPLFFLNYWSTRLDQISNRLCDETITVLPFSVQCSMNSCFETKFDTIHHAPFAFWSQLSWVCCLSCSKPFNPKTFQCKIITGFENYQCHTMILPTMMVAGLNMKIKKQPKKYCNLRESKDMRKRVVQLLDSLLSRRPRDA